MKAIVTGAVMALAITTARAVDADSGNYQLPYSTTDDLGFLDGSERDFALFEWTFQSGQIRHAISSRLRRESDQQCWPPEYGPPGSSSMPSMRHQSVEEDESPSRTAEAGASCGNALGWHRDWVHWLFRNRARPPSSSIGSAASPRQPDITKVTYALWTGDEARDPRDMLEAHDNVDWALKENGWGTFRIRRHCGGGAAAAGAIVSNDISNMRFHSDPNLEPTEIQPPTTEQRTPLA
jgi:hypothetical protein